MEHKFEGRLVEAFPSVEAQNFGCYVRRELHEKLATSTLEEQQRIFSILRDVVRRTAILAGDASLALAVVHDQVTSFINAEELKIAALCLAYDVVWRYGDMDYDQGLGIADTGRYILEKATKEGEGKVAEFAAQLLEWLENPNPDPAHPRYEELLPVAA